MNMLATYFVPIFILLAFIGATIAKKDVYNSFVSGVNGVIDLLLTIFPYVAAVLVMSELMQASGLNDFLQKLFTPLFRFFKIPPQLFRLILLKPFSGSGSLAILNDIFATYSPDSYIGRCAACVYGSSETIFYISVIYYSKCKTKRLKAAISISLLSTFVSCIFACFICAVMPS